MIKHLIELFLCQIRVSIKHLVALDFDDVRFYNSAKTGHEKGTARCKKAHSEKPTTALSSGEAARGAPAAALCIKILDFGNSVTADVDVHGLAGGLSSDDAALASTTILENGARAQPNRVDHELLIEHFERLLQRVNGHQHVLHNVELLVKLAQLLRLSDLEHLRRRRHHPAQHIAEHRVVAEGDDVLHLPEQRLGVTVVVVAKRNVLSAIVHAGEILLDMQIKPGLVPPANAVDDAVGRHVRSIVAQHDHELVGGVRS